MSTSEFGFLIATDPLVYCAENKPLGPVVTRTVLNNLNHLSDEAAQVRVNDGTARQPTTVTANFPWLIISYMVPVTQRQSGDSYKMRIRIAGAAETAGTNVYFTAVLGTPTASGARGSWGGFGDQEFVTSTTSSDTPAWLTGTSQGPAASGTLVYLPSALVTTQAFDTLDTVGGSRKTVNVPMTQLSIYGTTANATVKPVLYHVYLAEYVGL